MPSALETQSVNYWTAREVPIFSFSQWNLSDAAAFFLPLQPSKSGWCQLWLPAHLLSIPSASLLIWTSSSCTRLIITTSLLFSPCVDPPHRPTWVFLDANLFHVMSVLRMKSKLFKRVDKAFVIWALPMHPASFFTTLSFLLSFFHLNKRILTLLCVLNRLLTNKTNKIGFLGDFPRSPVVKTPCFQ